MLHFSLICSVLFSVLTAGTILLQKIKANLEATGDHKIWEKSRLKLYESKTLNCHLQTEVQSRFHKYLDIERGWTIWTCHFCKWNWSNIINFTWFNLIVSAKYVYRMENEKSWEFTTSKNQFFFNLYEIIDVNKTCCGNYFIIYISQIITLYTLNAYNAVCTFYLNWGKKIILHPCLATDCKSDLTSLA